MAFHTASQLVREADDHTLFHCRLSNGTLPAGIHPCNLLRSSVTHSCRLHPAVPPVNYRVQKEGNQLLLLSVPRFISVATSPSSHNYFAAGKLTFILKIGSKVSYILKVIIAQAPFSPLYSPAWLSGWHCMLSTPGMVCRTVLGISMNL